MKQARPDHEEYLRRNLLHASAVGCGADIAAALARLRKIKRTPKWLIAMLDGALARAKAVAPEMAKWRNSAPDAPSYMRMHDQQRAKPRGQPR